MKKVDYYSNRHSCYMLQYHLVVVTKYRHPVIKEELKDYLLTLSEELFKNKWKCNILSINTDIDHIHIVFEAPPQIQLSNLINSYKTVTSRMVRKNFKEELAPYYWKPYFWNRSYFISTVSERTESVVRNYIENQGS